jgi:porphobilinogen synthase
VNLLERPRRLRSTDAVRNLVAEVSLRLDHLIQPYFSTARSIESEPIPGFSGVCRWGSDALVRRVEKDLERGVRSFLLFGAAETKDLTGSESLSPESAVPKTLRRLRQEFGSVPALYTDVCLCPYTSHGHCGVWNNGQVDNDTTLSLLSQMALVHAEAGADFVAPSDMMDGRVAAIRGVLDGAGKNGVGVLAYTAKYASNYYGPFRQALDCSPEAGSDRRGYQMDFRNRREAEREVRLDIHEGADMLMVKPALAYLDILSDFRKMSDLPVIAYSVSGEYQMVKLMAKEGLADERLLALENLFAIRRAGASGIITYFASEAAEQGWLR